MDKRTIIIVSVVVVVLIIAFYLTYKSGRFTQSNQKPPKVGDVSAERVLQLESLASRLHEDMDGVNYSWEHGIYEEVSLLNDNELVVLSNLFNSVYEQESGDTFYQWIDNEYFSWDSFALTTLTDTIKNRLAELGVN